MSFPFPDVSDHSLSDLLSLAGRRAVVTGAAQGLGKAIASRMAEAGADLLLIDLNEDAVEATALEIAQRHGVRVIGARTDVTDSASVINAADLAVSHFGGIDVWVNNAGIFPNAPATIMPDEMWDATFAVNARGVFLGAREAARRMSANGSGGVIINIISTAGVHVAFPGMAAYVGSKHAALGMTKSLAVDLAPLGIRVLGVAPSFVPTEGNLAAAKAGADAAAEAGVELPSLDVMNTSMIGRIGTPDDIARVVLFAASDLSMIMTGTTLMADAGETL
ncbi:SDR family NAD(P)-dependent oxidoreductase [Microbacterium sp. YY-01]|uniref:SDR family NAD(P)-dependent oxidoreductase n=1 Tax=Microbacterium sp. YY-01 TaxID=3421634 RepID=UPI003D17A6E3